MTATDSDVYYDPYDFDIDADPYPVWKRLRDERPLYYNERYDFYALSRFDDVRGDRSLVGHPEDRPVGALTGQPQHGRAQGGQENRRGRDVGDVERVVDAEQVVLDVDRAGAAERLVENVEVGAHRPSRVLVGQPEHLFDDPMV